MPEWYHKIPQFYRSKELFRSPSRQALVPKKSPRLNDFNKHVRTRTNVTEIEYRQEKMTIKNTDRQY